MSISATQERIARRKAPLTTPSDIDAKAVTDITGGLNALLADVFRMYVKTKNFHWHMSGPHFRDYHLLLDDHGDQLFAMTDEIAERVRKIGGTTIRSIGHIARLRRILDNDVDFVTPADMLSELREDEKALTLSMRAVHTLCDDASDFATASLLENWIDQSQRRRWVSIRVDSRVITIHTDFDQSVACGARSWAPRAISCSSGWIVLYASVISL